MTQEETCISDAVDNKRNKYPNPEILGEQYQLMDTGIRREDAEITFQAQKCLERERMWREELERRYELWGFEE
jgi:hypothetical protein